MADAFEERLAAMFEETPEEGSESAFLLAVEAKLEARRAQRRLFGLILAAGTAVSAAAVVAATGVSKPFADLIISAGPRVGALVPALTGMPLVQAEVGWTVLGLAALLAAAGANRLVEGAAR